MKQKRRNSLRYYTVNGQWRENGEKRKKTDIATCYQSDDKPYFKSMITGQKYYFNQVQWL